MSDTKTLHPLIVRIVSIRDGFYPEVTDDEIRQMQEIADENPDLDVEPLNLKLNEEFGLQKRYDACVTRQNDIDAMTNDFKELIVKWKIAPMADPMIIAGTVLHHLNGINAVMGAYVEDLYKRAGGEKAADNVVEMNVQNHS